MDVQWNFFVQNAVALVQEVPLHCIQQRHADAMRKYALKKLLDVAQPPSRERVRCDAVSCKEPRTSTVRWVYCDVCGRWLHFVCANIRRKLRDSYVLWYATPSMTE